MKSFWHWIACMSFLLSAWGQKRSFIIDFENDQFLKDGKPFQYISGSLHYFRIPQIYWQDRLEKLVAAGFNTVQTYVEWSLHEPVPEAYSFDGDRNVTQFISLAHELGLLVIVRIGPYICAERDMGGLPFWLLQEKPSIRLRSSDPSYLMYVDRWFSVLLPKLKPLLYSAGGPIIAVQVENEYGGYPECDKNYLWHLHGTVSSFLPDVVLFTTDAAHDQNLECGTIDGFYRTVDFEPTRDVMDAFATMRRHQVKGPLVNSELYVGWLDHWSYGHTNTFSDTEIILEAMNKILAMNASLNLYMFHGGTSFGFSNGANDDSGEYEACPTSYDYNAPLSEAGDPTDKYFKIRQLLSNFQHIPLPVPPGPTKKYAYGKVYLKQMTSLVSLLNTLTMPSFESIYPVTFEKLGQGYGFVLYETVIQSIVMDPVLLQVPGLRDRGIVFINESMKGILSRQGEMLSMPLKIQKGDKLWIFVENQGRITYGPNITDFKGIVENVTLGDVILKSWKMTPINLNTLVSSLSQVAMKKYGTYNKQNKCLHKKNQNYRSSVDTPGFFAGTFSIPATLNTTVDTFLSTPGWHKGVAFINGKNIGRYWPAVGPQMTLFVPKSFLNPINEMNTILLFELEETPCAKATVSNQCFVEFVSEPNINGTTPYPAPPL